MTHRATRLFIPLLLLLALLSAQPGNLARAQESAPPPAIDKAGIESALKTLQEKAELDEAVRTRGAELYNQALEALKGLDATQQSAAQFTELLNNADAKTKALEAELARTLESPTGTVPEGATAGEIEQRVNDTDAAANAAQAERAALEQESAGRAERRRQIPELQAAARQRLTEAQAEIEAAGGATDAPELVEARKSLATARTAAAQQELNALELELQTYDLRGRMLSLQLDGATRRAEHFKREAAQLRELLAARRQHEALEAANRAREALLEATNAPEAIRELAAGLAQENTALTQERTGPEGLLRRIEDASARLNTMKEKLNNQSSDFTGLKARVDAAGIGAATGALLRSHQRNLGDVRRMARNIRERQQEIGRTQESEIQCEAERRGLADVESLVQNALQGVSQDTPEAERAEFANVLRTLYNNRRDILDDMIEDYEKYFALLIDLDAQEQLLITQTSEFKQYITERVLWLRSADLISIDELQPIREALVWLVAPENVTGFAQALATDFSSTPVPVLAGALGILLLNALRWRFLGRVYVAAEEATKRGCMVFRPTVAATIYTLLASAGPSLIFAFIGWRCLVSIGSTDYVRAVGGALSASAFFLWTLEFAREVLRSNGLAIAHFGWSESSCRAASRRLLLFELVAVPLLLIVVALDLYDQNQQNDWPETAGRLALVIGLLAQAAFGHLMLRKRNGAVLEIIERARKRTNLKLRRLWYAMAVLTPVALLLAAAYGYSYSALRIAAQLHYLVFCAFCLIVVVHLVLRWMLISRRQMARARARKKLEAMREAGGDGEIAAPPQEDEVDLDKVDAQAMRLIRSSFAVALAFCAWWIWSDDLPALSVLNRVELWTVTDTVVTETKDAAGAVIRDAKESQVPITLRHVAAFIFIAGITTIAVRNLPGLLEILLWQRLSLMAGERYAANTIITYALTLIGGTWAFSAIGLSWGKLQWLFAAVGLGLGFGLQEIFANLVSGIILLFERPVRVGDVVTVGDISGTVTRIRIRATWITTFTRQELIVPNKEFVTGRLINWTLSDRVLRIEMPVGIAYGSDIALAKRLMLEAAESHPAIASDPPPTVFFTGFADSALSFVVRAHCVDLDTANGTKDEILTAIDAAFRANGIELPFPQRDIHLHGVTTTPTGELKLKTEEDRTGRTGGTVKD